LGITYVIHLPSCCY